MISFLSQFRNDCKTLGFEKHTIESYISNIRIFFKYVNIKPAHFEISDLSNFLNYLRYGIQIYQGNKIKIGATKSTIKTYFSSLHTFFDFLEFNGYIDENPIPKFRRRYIRHIKKDRGPESTRQLISVAQMAQFVYSNYGSSRTGHNSISGEDWGT